MPTSEDHRVWFVAWPGLQSLDLVGPFEVFATANRVADGLDRGGVRYRMKVISQQQHEIETESGLRLATEQIPTSSSGPNTLVLPGGDGVYEASQDPALVAAVARLGKAADRVATVCTGTFLGAAAGLLDGKRVATHWARAPRLAETNPSLEVDPDSLYIHDGRVWSSAGVTAGIDMALAIVEHDHDAEVAQVAARWLVLHLRRPGGQSQFASPVWHEPSAVEPVRRAQEAILAQPGADHRVVVLARRSGLSARHFSRVFTGETGQSPAVFVERVRVDAARRELETGSTGLVVVARRCGFGTVETLRRAFHRRLGLSPDEYRRRFRLDAAS